MDVIFLVVGIIVGAFGMVLLSRLKSPGTIVIDHSDPECPYPFLEGKVPLEMLARYKWVTLDVQVRDYLSQK